jgi:hypothetical protein
MSLRKVKIIDTNFAHAKYSTDYQESKYIEWVRNIPPNNDEIIFFTDNSMYNVDKIKNCKKIGMLMEPKAINFNIYDWISKNHNKFDLILTYDKALINNFDNIEFYPHCGCWIKEKDHKIYDKSKLLSIVASNKSQTNGHKLRHIAISELKEKKFDLDVFGRGYNSIDYKLTSLKDYAFSLIIENSRSDYYFTEKLIDSFVTGTVPIYWGCPSIGNFFNLDGMIIFEDIKDLLCKINLLSFDKYNKMLPAIKENFIKTKEFLIAEDWIYKNTNIFK